MPPKGLHKHQSLEAAVRALKLKEERFTIDHTASKRTNTDSIASGFYYYPSLEDLPLWVLRMGAMTVDLRKKVKSMEKDYFPNEQEETKSEKGLGSSSVQKVEVDEDLINNSIVSSNPGLRISLHNAMLSATAKWLKSNLDKITNDPNSNAYPLIFVKRDTSNVLSKELDRSLFPLSIDMLRLQDDPNALPEDLYAYRTRQRAWLDTLNLTTPAVGECLSELSVQQVAGAAVKKMFHLPGTTVYSDKNLPHASELMMAPRKNPPKADFVTLDISSELEKHLSLVLIAGEAKRNDTAKADDKGPNYRSQLQSAIYPSLVLLLLLHTRRSKSGKTTALPEDLFLYGVYYDEFRFEFYVHFPYWNTKRAENDDNDDLTEGWRFVQVHVGTFLVAQYSEDGPISALRSVRLAVALQAARAHGEQVARSFSRENYKTEWDLLLGMTWSSSPKPVKAVAVGPARTMAQNRTLEKITEAE